MAALIPKSFCISKLKLKAVKLFSTESFPSYKPSKVTSLFRISTEQSEIQCHSQMLMLKEGLVSPGITGSFHLLPFATKSLHKLVDIVTFYLNCIGGQELIIPQLTSEQLWKVSGRLDKMGSELFKLKDRNGHLLCLGPTHEESVTDLIASLPKQSYRQLPIILYQVTTKFRDEMRPRFGLLRGREFIMKDMYSFDKDEESAKKTYNLVSETYQNIFKEIGLDVVKVQGSTGSMGGTTSHEFQILADIGEDLIHICKNCNHGINSELLEDNVNLSCSNCGETTFEQSKGIEIGHLFLLGETYSKPFKAKYLDEAGKLQFYYMGCYGLGITRILAAAIEFLSTAKRIQWPLKLAPYLVAVIPPKKGSKEGSLDIVNHMAEYITSSLGFGNNVIIDDRVQFTIGKRIHDLKSVGIPYLLVAGKKASEDIPRFELIDVYKEETLVLTHSECMHFFRDIYREAIFQK